MKIFVPLFFLVVLFGCGYHFEGGNGKKDLIGISIPYIKGDREGRLNAELVEVLSISGIFDYVQNGGEYTLQAAIISDGDERIGYRFDRNPTSGKLRDNIVGTENRRTMAVQISLLHNPTQEILLEPLTITATADYDYFDPNSIRDLTFIGPHGTPQKVLDFSLGQLDSLEGAHDDSAAVIYRDLAQKIVKGLIIHDTACRRSSSAS